MISFKKVAENDTLSGDHDYILLQRIVEILINASNKKLQNKINELIRKSKMENCRKN